MSKINVSNLNQTGTRTINTIGKLEALPSDEDFEDALEKESFRVPYDGSNKFYDEDVIKHWRNCWAWIKSFIEK